MHKFHAWKLWGFSGIIKDLTFSSLALILLNNLATFSAEAFSLAARFWSTSLLYFLHAYLFVPFFCILTWESISDLVCPIPFGPVRPTQGPHLIRASFI